MDRKWSRRLLDLSGQRFGRLTVIRKAEPQKRHVRWLCLCDCGGERAVFSQNLMRGNATNCGCGIDGRGYLRRRHGSNNRLYSIWSGMIERCHRERAPAYRQYGAQGIAVCPEWREPNGFDVFAAWALSNGYEDALTLDRIENAHGYSPANCRWATILEQARNRRDNVWFEINGERLTMSEAARKFGLTRQAVQQRIKSGWPEYALFNPPGVQPIRVTMIG